MIEISLLGKLVRMLKAIAQERLKNVNIVCGFLRTSVVFLDVL